MLTVNKLAYIESTLHSVFDGAYEWDPMADMEDFGGAFVFTIRMRVDEMPRFFRTIQAIFPNHHVTLAADSFRVGERHSAFLEVGIRPLR